jgi:hypothetical protein
MADLLGWTRFSRRNRSVRVALLTLGAVLLASGQACGGGSVSAAARELPAIRNASRVLLGSADEAAREGRLAQDLVDGLGAKVDDLNRYKKALTAEDRRLLTSLRTSQAAILDIQAVRAAADSAVQIADSDAASLASSAIRGNHLDAFLEDVEAVTKDVVKSTGCDLVADVLLPSERLSVASDRPTVVPSSKAIIDATINRLAVRWRLADVQAALNWTGWGNGALGAAKKMAQAPTGTVQLPSGAHSRALYYYVKICHSLPS